MNTALAVSTSFTLESDNGFAQVWLNNVTQERALISTRSFEPGEVICSFGAGKMLDHPTYLTVQVSDKDHILLQPEFLQYIDHSCDPNTFFDTTLFDLLCVRPIKAGDALTFFYPSAEWEMDQPFACRCQSANCLKYISGAAHLSKEVLSAYRLTDHIKRKLSER